MTNAAETNTRRTRIGRKLVTEHRYIVWIDGGDSLNAAADFWMEEYGDKNAHPRVAEVVEEYGSFYAVRLAEKGEPR